VERPYERFSFFASAWLERGPPALPLPEPAALPPLPRRVGASLSLDELELLPRRPD